MEGKQGRVLRAIADGCESAADVEADLDFTMTRKRIAGHLSNLLRAGRIVKIGEFKVEVTRANGQTGAVRTYRYGLPGRT
jgi:hypothetical protein